jgi:hypothetical protein
MLPKRNKATITFLENVKMLESIPETPNLLTKTEKPLTKAVNTTNIKPLLLFI